MAESCNLPKEYVKEEAAEGNHPSMKKMMKNMSRKPKRGTRKSSR